VFRTAPLDCPHNIAEPELFRGYDPNKKIFSQEIELTHDLEPFEVTEAEAQKFKLQHGDKCDIWAGEGGQWFAKPKAGSYIHVYKALKFSRTVAGQIPSGWYAGRYGIPDDIAGQVDRSTQWALVCAAEALINSGITDPYELYQHMHPSEVGTCIGSGMGGMMSLEQMFRDRRDEKDVQNDILQETYVDSQSFVFAFLPYLDSSTPPLVGSTCSSCRLLVPSRFPLVPGKSYHTSASRTSNTLPAQLLSSHWTLLPRRS